MRYQSRKQRQALNRAVEKHLLPLVFEQTLSYDDIKSCDNMYSGDVSAVLLNAFTFGKLNLTWDIEDEKRVASFDENKIDSEDAEIFDIVFDIRNIWRSRMMEAHIVFDFDYQEETSFSDIAETISNVGNWLGINTDVEAVVEGVPTADILA